MCVSLPCIPNLADWRLLDQTCICWCCCNESVSLCRCTKWSSPVNKLATLRSCQSIVAHVVIARQPIMHLFLLMENNLYQSWPKVCMCLHVGKKIYSRAGLSDQGSRNLWDLLISCNEIRFFESDGFRFSATRHWSNENPNHWSAMYAITGWAGWDAVCRESAPKCLHQSVCPVYTSSCISILY